MALTNKLKAIADAIRAKTGSTEKLTLDGMASAISNISTGGGELPSFSFTGRQMEGLFQNDRLTPLHDIGYTTSNITKLTYAYEYVNIPTLKTPMINLATTQSNSISCDWAFSHTRLDTVNINVADGTYINPYGMFSDSTVKKINFTGTPKVKTSYWGDRVSSIFNSCPNLQEIPTIEIVRDTSDSENQIRLNEMFNNCWKLKHRDDEIIIDHADFYNNGKDTARFDSSFNGNQSMEKIPGWVYGFTNSPNLFTYSNLYFGQCYSLQNVLLPMSNNVVYISNPLYDNYAAKSIKFQTQENGTPYTANWTNSITWDLTSNTGYSSVGNYWPYTTYLIKDEQDNIHTFTNAREFIEYAATLNSPTAIGCKYMNGVVEESTWYNSSSSRFEQFWDYKLVYCWSLEDAQAIRDKGYIPYGVYTHYSLYNHDSAVETINSLPDCSGCAAQTIKFKGRAGEAYNKAISTLTAEEIAVATAKNWTVALV